MSRPLRIEFPGAVYHVTSRGDRREPIFEDDTDRAGLLTVLGQGLQRFDACALAYCLMGNHYHFVLHTRQANLSQLMRHVNGVYTQAFNRRHGKVGHLFQGRFKAILVDQDAYLLEVCRYVELNPVRAGMVSEPGLWPWSSYRAHTGQAPVLPWLDTPAVHGYLLGRDAQSATDAQEAGRLYAQLVAAAVNVRLWDEALTQQIYLGDAGFVERMQALLVNRVEALANVPREQRQAPALPLAWFFENLPRDQAMLRAHVQGGYSMTDIAQTARLSVSRVSRIIKQAEAHEVRIRSCLLPSHPARHETSRPCNPR